MKYAKIVSGKIDQIQGYSDSNCNIEVPDDAVCGMSFSNGSLSTPAIPLSSRIEGIRNERNAKLRNSDWSDLPNCRLTDAKKTAWAAYRDLLFDLPATLNESNIDSFTWPIEPGA